MSELNDKKVDDELVKSLAEELDMSEEEINSLLKSEEEGSEEDDDEKKKDSESEEDDAKSEEEDAEKSETIDLKDMSEDDIKKSVSLYMEELKSRAPKKDLQKSSQDDLIKSFETSLHEVKRGVDNTVGELKEQIEELQKSINQIGEASQGAKAMKFDFIAKSEDEGSFEKDGKTYISSSDRELISNKLLSFIEKSEDDDFKNQTSVDLINYQASGEFSKSMLKTLNENDIYFKEQMKEK